MKAVYWIKSQFTSLIYKNTSNICNAQKKTLSISTYLKLDRGFS